MNDPLADFQNRLYSIRPFIETQSPPSSSRKQRRESEELESARKGFQTGCDGYDPFKELTPLRRVVSESREVQAAQRLGDSNYKTISSISSTIDMLFSKIEKIKQQFSYALDKPHSTTDIHPQTYIPHFHSEKIVENTLPNGNSNKENIFAKEETEIGHKVEEACRAQGRLLMHSQSLPLQDHNQNLGLRDYSSHPAQIKSPGQPINLFQNFCPQPVPSAHLRISDFELGKCIGSGKFGDVYLSMHRATGFLCAIKKIFKSTIREYRMEEQLATELRIHYSLSHPHIVQLYGHFDDQYHIFLMMEYACGGTLMETLKCEEAQASRAIDQVLDAVAYLHRKRVVHRDIKPQNIVCSLGVAKLCDFGWAAVLQNQMKRTFCGTLDYVSPEMKDVGEYNESVDLWSIGVLTFQLLAGFPPYKHEISYWRLCGSQRKMRWNWEVIYPPEMSYSAHRFIEGLLKENPVERASIQECKCSVFICRHCQQMDRALEQEFQF